MKHSIKDQKTGRFTKQLVVEETKPIRKIGVTEIVLTAIVLGVLLVIVDMYIIKIF